MSYRLGHARDRFGNDNDIGANNLPEEEGFVSDPRKKPRPAVDNVNKFIGDIAKDYMETTKREHWTSDLINHLNARFPNEVPMEYTGQRILGHGMQKLNQQEPWDARFTSFRSSLPNSLIPPGFRNLHPSHPLDVSMNGGYSCYNSASINKPNMQYPRGSTLMDYRQNVGSTTVPCDGRNSISQLRVNQADMEHMTSPEQVSSVTAVSYGDGISDTEAFDSTAALPGTILHPSIGENQIAHNMGFQPILVNDAQSFYSDSCNTQRPNVQNLVQSQLEMPRFQQLDQWAHQPSVQFGGSESSCHVSSHQILSSYVMYKSMPADLRNNVSFRDYMHSTECKNHPCNCPLYLHLASHFESCNDPDCNICGSARWVCADNSRFESRKRKHVISEASSHGRSSSSGTLLDMLPPKCLKTESSVTIGDVSSQEISASLNQKALPDELPHLEQWPKTSVLDTTVPEVNTKPLTAAAADPKAEITTDQKTNSGLETEKIKKQSVSLADFLTAAEIKEHLLSFTPQKGVSENATHSVGQNSCQLCSLDKLLFAPAPIYCASCDSRIKRNVGYYRSADEEATKHCFCMPCFRGSRGASILALGVSVPKATLQKAKNDEEKEDSWVLCDKCQRWQHRICGLYNDERDTEGKAEYVCPKCCLEEIENGKHGPFSHTVALGAKDLPRTNLSDHIEQRLSRRLKQEKEQMAKVLGLEAEEVPGAEDLVVRVVVSVDKHLKVKQQFIDVLHGEDYPAEFVYQSKLIFLFQKIEGVDVCLFGMYVQEFGSECGGPNQRCVYISYLDSVKYFRPERKSVTGESLRTFVYHEILIGYLEYCKKRGFATCYIWACPLIRGEDYIFYCHPDNQKTPKQEKLRQWYKLMLKKAAEDDVVVDHTNLYNEFFLPCGLGNTKITAARLPYFDGDYWSETAESIIKKLDQEESARGLQSKLPAKRILIAMGQDNPDVAKKDVLLMQKLGQIIMPVKENFMVVRLQFACTYCRKVISSGSRWFCSQCKKIQLCSRCFDAHQLHYGSKKHKCRSGEDNLLCEALSNDLNLGTDDKDGVLSNSLFETRNAFLNKCQKLNFQFNTLCFAKYSSMMILYHMHKSATKHGEIEGGASRAHKLNRPLKKVISQTETEQHQKQKEAIIKAALDVLDHAAQCKSMGCPYKECQKMRKLFHHASVCPVRAPGGCVFCLRAWAILKEHSQICRDSNCGVPRCMDIKKHRETRKCE